MILDFADASTFATHAPSVDDSPAVAGAVVQGPDQARVDGEGCAQPIAVRAAATAVEGVE
ncbi:hypothetical protein [Kitasatospora sp. NPDC059327]|uniref:hypothetical protein n=1 Tax=Kitasatospora sp. NPDC059327 TaxID=3346803 RepID=UPI0036A1C7F7